MESHRTANLVQMLQCRVNVNYVAVSTPEFLQARSKNIQGGKLLNIFS